MDYANYNNVEIVVSLLKKNNICDLVISPGGTNIPIIQAVQDDAFFNCVSVVDERSAAYVAIGIYLPLELTAPIMIGGVLRKIMDKKNNSSSSESSKGVLFSSGLIAGEGLLGVLLAILTVAGVADKIAFGAAIPNVIRVIGSVVVFALLLVLMVKYALPGKNEKAK